MSDTNHCPKCGTEIPADARWGICPKCLLDPAAGPTPEALEPDDAASRESGRRFAGYELGRQIGRGGMGVVYEALQLRPRRTVALKMMLDSLSLSEKWRRRFAIEAEAAARLDHPNIVAIYEVGEHQDQLFLSMKLVQGESLRQKIRKGELGVAANAGASTSTPLPLRERQVAAARLIAQVARAVHHAHQHGVLHRDLKPGNILIDADGQPHLTDFGLAILVDGPNRHDTHVLPSQSSGIAGTVNYMSPEQASNKALSAASDVYSLGAALYELLTGEPPFTANTPLLTLKLVTEQEPKRPRSFNAGIDRDLETICLKCLEKGPESRYSSALAFAEDLERWLRQEPIKARPSGPLLRTRRWVKRNPIGACLIASLVAALAAASMLLQMARELQRQSEIIAGIAKIEFVRRTDELFAQPNMPYVELSSSMLAMLDGRTPRQADAQSPPQTFAFAISLNPVSQAKNCAPFIAALETEMSKRLHRPVFFTLRLYKARSWDSPAVESGDVEVQRMSPLTYVRLASTGSEVQPLVRSHGMSEAVIFARKSSGITNIAQVAGHRVAFAHTNSIVSFVAKVHCARAGVCATNVTYQNLLDPDRWQGKAKGEGPGNRIETDSDNEDYAHRIVVAKVLKGEFDVGVSPLQRFENNRDRGRGGEGLIEIHRFRVPRNLFVAKRGLPEEFVRHLQQSLLSIKDPSILGRLGRSMAEGLDAARDEDYDDIRHALANELKFFENGSTPQPIEKPNESPAAP